MASWAAASSGLASMTTRSRCETPDEAGDPDKKKNFGGPDAFGDVQNIIAAGKVRVVRKDPGGKDVVATAETATALEADHGVGRVLEVPGNPVYPGGGRAVYAVHDRSVLVANHDLDRGALLS